MATKAAIEDFDVEELRFCCVDGKCLRRRSANFLKNLSCGSPFFDLDATDLKELFPLIGDRKAVKKLIASYNPVKQHIRTDHSYVDALMF